MQCRGICWLHESTTSWHQLLVDTPMPKRMLVTRDSVTFTMISTHDDDDDDDDDGDDSPHLQRESVPETCKNIYLLLWLLIFFRVARKFIKIDRRSLEKKFKLRKLHLSPSGAMEHSDRWVWPQPVGSRDRHLTSPSIFSSSIVCLIRSHPRPSAWSALTFLLFF